MKKFLALSAGVVLSLGVSNAFALDMDLELSCTVQDAVRADVYGSTFFDRHTQDSVSGYFDRDFYANQTINRGSQSVTALSYLQDYPGEVSSLFVQHNKHGIADSETPNYFAHGVFCEGDSFPLPFESSVRVSEINVSGRFVYVSQFLNSYVDTGGQVGFFYRDVFVDPVDLTPLFVDENYYEDTDKLSFTLSEILMGVDGVSESYRYVHGSAKIHGTTSATGSYGGYVNSHIQSYFSLKVKDLVTQEVKHILLSNTYWTHFGGGLDYDDSFSDAGSHDLARVEVPLDMNLEGIQIYHDESRIHFSDGNYVCNANDDSLIFVVCE